MNDEAIVIEPFGVDLPYFYIDRKTHRLFSCIGSIIAENDSSGLLAARREQYHKLVNQERGAADTGSSPARKMSDIRCPHCKQEVLGQSTLDLEVCKDMESVNHRPVFLIRYCHTRECRRTYWVVSK